MHPVSVNSGTGNEGIDAQYRSSAERGSDSQPVRDPERRRGSRHRHAAVDILVVGGGHAHGGILHGQGGIVHAHGRILDAAGHPKRDDLEGDFLAFDGVTEVLCDVRLVVVLVHKVSGGAHAQD